MNGVYVNNIIESISENDSIEEVLKNRISDLNEIIGELKQEKYDLSIENTKLKKENAEIKEENIFLKGLLKFSRCIYPIYMAIEPIENILDIELTEKDVLDIIRDAKIDGAFFVIDVRVNRNDDKPTKFISVLCMARIIDYLKSYMNTVDAAIEEASEKCPENFDEVAKKIEKNYSTKDINV